MKKVKNFSIEEVVPKTVASLFGERAWMFFRPEALISLEQIRGHFGPCTVNDYKWGGGNQWRGLRTPDSPVGAKFSAHRFGAGFDVTANSGVSGEEMRNYIFAHPEKFPLIRRIEIGVPHLHFDVFDEGPGIKKITP